MSDSSSHSLLHNNEILESSLENGGVHFLKKERKLQARFIFLVTNLCKDLHHLGVVGLTYVQELPPPLFGINQEESLLLGRPLLLQRLLTEHRHY